MLELLVTVLAVGVLAALTLAGFVGFTERAHQAAARANLQVVSTAVVAAAEQSGLGS